MTMTAGLIGFAAMAVLGVLAGELRDLREALDRAWLRIELLEGMMADSDAIKRLLERLQTGWAPQADEIGPVVRQVDALNWQWNFEDAGTIVPLGISYQTIDRQPRK